MDNYFSEIARVLKQRGRCIITFFLLNRESLRRIESGLSAIQLPFIYKANTCRIAHKKTPETTVAHDEQVVRNLYDQNKLSITEITYGFWCGRKDLVGSFHRAVQAYTELVL